MTHGFGQSTGVSTYQALLHLDCFVRVVKEYSALWSALIATADCVVRSQVGVRYLEMATGSVLRVRPLENKVDFPSECVLYRTLINI